MDVAQGVHDALTFDSSQRPGEQGEIEAPPRAVHLRRSGRGERHTVGELGRSCCDRVRDLLLVGVDGQDRLGLMRVSKREPTVPTAELEHT
jgi:hypothetical protein